MVLTAGDRLGHYEILALVGAGGMGQVYRARDTLLRRTVAIKVLHADLAGDPAERLLREARAASALSHPHICRVYSVEASAGRSFIVMEHVSGKPLRSVLDHRLPPAQVSRYGSQIARAIGHAHEHGVVHRDLKSGNVMITDEDEAVVLDFGIAAHLEQERDEPTAVATGAGAAAGTIAYMAPERLRGAPGDERGDVWSLGVVLYEMAAGALPFTGDTGYALTAAILEQPMAPLPAAVPLPVRRVIERCLEKNPARRYRNAGEVAAGLDASGSAAPHVRAALPRRAWVAIAAGVLVAAVLAAVAVNRRDAIGPAGDRPAGAVAILPLRVIGGASEEQYLGVGVADAIITKLALLRQVVLRPTTAVLPYANQAPDVVAAGAALGVDHVVVGTIQPSDAAYRISLQLVRVGDGAVGWGQTLDVARGNLLALQDSVAEQIVAALSLELSGNERARLTVRETESNEAYAEYVRGRTLLVNYTEANMRQAIESFEGALAIDPGYARARAALATACAWFSVRFAYGAGAIEWGQRAEREARAALAQDASLADAHSAIASAAGTLYRGFDWQVLLAESAQALALDPTLDLPHVHRMRAFYHLGEFDRAADEGRQARLLSPAFNVEVERLEVASKLFGGDFAGARALAQQLLERTDAAAIRWYLGLARYYLGDVTGAREMLLSARQGDQPDVRSQASLASIEAAAGDHNAARRRARGIESGPYMDHHVAYSLGATWAQLGDAAASVGWLQRAVETGFPCSPWFRADTLLDPIRGEPSFVRLLDQLPPARGR